MPDWLYRYPPLLQGKLLKRYKRFFADIELESGDIITAHCPNTGPMTCISTPGAWVYVSRSENPARKLAYTWEMIQVSDPIDGEPTEPTWVGVNTAMPNRIVKLALNQHVFPELGTYEVVEAEVPYGASRIDFRLSDTPDDRPIYLEVKSTTWVRDRIALFPDTVTTRGQKHLHDMMALLPDARAVMLYFINRGDRTCFAPGDSADPVYGTLLRQAVQQGLEVLPCRFEVSPEGIRYLGLAELDLAEPVGHS
jgi:sugar fermentation stimulation protein A